MGYDPKCDCESCVDRRRDARDVVDGHEDEIERLRAENAELRARVEKSEADDAVRWRSALEDIARLTRDGAELRADAETARKERDAALALAASRPDITPAMAHDSLRYDNMEWLTSEQRDQLGAAADAVVAALREHAKGAKS
jgi:hypothetical protein